MKELTKEQMEIVEETIASSLFHTSVEGETLDPEEEGKLIEFVRGFATKSTKEIQQNIMIKIANKEAIEDTMEDRVDCDCEGPHDEDCNV